MSQDLMISQNNRPLDLTLMNQRAGFEVSSKYVPISTQEVLDEIKAYTGIEPKITGFNKRNVRKPGKQGFQGHSLIAEMPDSSMIDGTSMNMILFNSNDRSSALKVHIGAIRAACSNQLVWGDEVTEPLSIRHSQKEWKHSIHTLMDEYEEAQVQTEEMIKRLMNTYMSYGDMGRLTERVAHELLEPEITGTILDPMQLNLVTRKEDAGKTAWHTFNRIQSSIINGGIDRIIPKDNEEGILFDSVSKTHKISDISKQISMNKKLHSIVMEAI